MSVSTLRRFVFVLILMGAGLLYAEKRYDIPVGDEPFLGPADAPVRVIEFLDFQ